MQCFLLKLILFFTFPDFQQSKVEKIYSIWVPRLWCNVFLLNWLCFWLFMKLQKKLVEIFTAFECPDCDTKFSSHIDFVLDFSWSFGKVEEIFFSIWVPRLWYNVFFLNWFFYFSWSFSKLEESFMAFECPDCKTMFSSYIDFVFYFSWSFRKNWLKYLRHFNA